VTSESVHYRFEQVAEGAWAAAAIDSGAGVGNMGIADLGGRALVVDCGFTPAAARDVRAAAETLVGPVERVVITHGDFDHYGGARAFADVPILASERTCAVIAENGPGRVSGLQAEFETYMAELEERGAPDWELEQGRRIAAEIPGLQLSIPTETFTDERDLGPVQVIDCGKAHSASDAVVWFSEAGVLFAADLVPVESHLNLTRGDPENWLRALDRFEALGPRQIVPGHGSPAGAEAIGAARAYIERLLALAVEPGDHELPPEWAGWSFAEGFQQNIDALRQMVDR
jgi:cyclase